ncbi:L,D-transpeptidase family protein [Halovulum dunhuangense]|uniref:L,D-transpeptidase family protein n=1 Tax=Halovulum dunhuangense TaxID=1505036 RepID=A0A849KY26_9RHOB|nr:L,D-transpeptidase family protein [Halovulum dunhuangense]NNU78866.1 L,D-transpeptidase family protein [Halovulum dunhuangense]
MRAQDLVVTARGARFRGRSLSCAVGRGGITRDKREGDGATPAGVHGFVGLLYRPDRIARSLLPDWARPIGAFDRWSDDPRDPDYNHYLPGAPDHPYGTERLRRRDPLYDVVLLTDWNWPYAEKGRGSAIFVHVWRKPRHPTAGCVAFALPDLLWIVNRLRHADRLIVKG